MVKKDNVPRPYITVSKLFVGTFREGNCDRIIAPRQPQMARAIGFPSREVSQKPCFWYCFARCIFWIRDGFLRDL
jgi:hypothetical protein